MVMRFNSSGRSGFGRSNSRIRLGSSHRSGVGLKVSHRQSGNAWRPPRKDDLLDEIDSFPRTAKKSRKKKKRKR
jgi:hypothetical protein